MADAVCLSRPRDARQDSVARFTSVLSDRFLITRRSELDKEDEHDNETPGVSQCVLRIF
jgi:hypothetical protein